MYQVATALYLHGVKLEPFLECTLEALGLGTGDFVPT